MNNTATLSASMLACESIDDERFFEATALLATRFDRRSEFGDLRSDPEAPQLLFDWFVHAEQRVPDPRVWDLSCQILDYFDPDFGLYLPHEWPWDTRDRLLRLADRLRARVEWVPVFERAVLRPEPATVRAIACCAAERLGVDPYSALWAYLCEHVDDGFAWYLLSRSIDERRLPAYLALARKTLLSDRDALVESSSLPAASPDSVPRSSKREDARWYVWREVLRLLERFPGEGLGLVEAALRSHDAGLRIQAVDLLGFHWGEYRLPLDTITLARELAAEEEHPVARERFDRLLQRA